MHWSLHLYLKLLYNLPFLLENKTIRNATSSLSSSMMMMAILKGLRSELCQQTGVYFCLKRKKVFVLYSSVPLLPSSSIFSLALSCVTRREGHHGNRFQAAWIKFIGSRIESDEIFLSSRKTLSLFLLCVVFVFRTTFSLLLFLYFLEKEK